MDVEYACFACGQDHTHDLDSVCSKCGTRFNISSLLLGQSIGAYRPVAQLGRGFYGTVFLAENRIGKKFALKVCPARLYEIRDKSFQDEIRNYIEVGNHPNIAELIDAGEATVHLGTSVIPVYYLVTSYVSGALTFEEFIETGQFDIEDLIGFCMQVCSAISRIEEKGLRHNDLHGRNILLAPRTSDVLDHHPASARYEVKLVDFGSALFSRPGHDLADIQMLGRHLEQMASSLRRRGDYLPKSEKWFLEQLPGPIAYASEGDPGRPTGSASELAAQLERLWEKSIGRGPWHPVKLSSAFGYTNANSFPDDSYVAALFSDHFPWLDQIGHAELPILLTGPRGCGKTMILRSLRLRSIISRISEDDTPDKRRRRFEAAGSVGFFVSAKLTFGLYRGTGDNPFWLSQPQLTNAFLNLAFLKEVADTLLYAAEDGIELISPGEAMDLLAELSPFIVLDDPQSAVQSIGFVSPLERLSRIATASIGSVTEGRIRPDEVGDLGGPRCLVQLWNFLSQRTRAFNDKRISFLLDDFTQPLVPEQCQRAFLPVMFRPSEYQFIVSAHSLSLATEDLDGVRYDPSREFREINLGREYVGASESKNICELFLEEVFQRRFRAANVFPGLKLRDLLGDSTYMGGGVAEEIVARHRRKTTRGFHFHGLDTLVHLCTGDVSSIIDLLGGMLKQHERLSRTSEPLSVPVSKADQNRRIRLYARREMLRLLDVRQFDGRMLFAIAESFGLMSRDKLLMSAKPTEGREPARPYQYLRIEVAQDRSLRSEKTLQALLQYGVFVDGGLGSSNKGTPTQKLIYRKLFAPVFPTTLSSRDSFSWTMATFRKFLKDPETVLYEERRKDPDQGTLFTHILELELEDLDDA
jgi:serine/threonine protein kinase